MNRQSASAGISSVYRYGERYLPLLAAIGFLLFLAIIPESFRTTAGSDFADRYGYAAQSVLAGKGYVGMDGAFFVWYPPGYSMVLLVVFMIGRLFGLTDFTSAQLLNTLFFALNVHFIIQIAKRVAPRIALLAGLLWLLYPPALWMAKLPYSETFYICLTLAAILSWLKQWDGENVPKWRPIVTGMLMGLAMLTRPIGLLTPVLLFIAFPLWRGKEATTFQKLRHALLITAGILVIVLPWQVTMKVKTGESPLIAKGGVYAAMDGMRRGVISGPRGFNVPDDVREYMADIYGKKDEIQSNGDLIRVMLVEGIQKPVTFAKFIFIKATRSWYGTDGQSEKVELIILLMQLPILVIGIWGLVVVARSQNIQRKNLFLIALAILLGHWAMSMLVVPLLRYTLPGMPLFFIAISCLVQDSFAKNARLGRALLLKDESSR